MSDRSASRQIYVVRPDGSALTQITHGGTYHVAPAWSPDGAWMAFVSNRDGNFDIYAMRADGSDVANLTHDPAIDTDPAWGR